MTVVSLKKRKKEKKNTESKKQHPHPILYKPKILNPNNKQQNRNKLRKKKEKSYKKGKISKEANLLISTKGTIYPSL